MPKCVECEKTFEIDEARAEYNDEFDGDLDYDEYYPEGNFCGSCAETDSSSLIAQGNERLDGSDYE
jgi:hypothetical protein